MNKIFLKIFIKGIYAEIGKLKKKIKILFQLKDFIKQLTKNQNDTIKVFKTLFEII